MTRKGTKILKPEFCEVSEDIFADPCFQPKGGFKYVFEWKDGTDNKKGNEYEIFVFFLVKREY
jgi:hypothetical protein